MNCDQSLIARILTEERAATDLQMQMLEIALVELHQRRQVECRLIEQLHDELPGRELRFSPYLDNDNDAAPQQ